MLFLLLFITWISLRQFFDYGEVDLQNEYKEETLRVTKKIAKERVLVVGLANMIDEKYCLSIASSLVNGYELFLYGERTFPRVIESNETSKKNAVEIFRQKMSAYMDFCQREDVRKNELIVFSDIRDVTYIKEAKSLRKAFNNLKNKEGKNVYYLTSGLHRLHLSFISNSSLTTDF